MNYKLLVLKYNTLLRLVNSISKPRLGAKSTLIQVSKEVPPIGTSLKESTLITIFLLFVTWTIDFLTGV